jgi:adenosylhomocysteine nucleosidase
MTGWQNPFANAASQLAQTDSSHADIGIACALPIELGAFLDRCQRVKKYVGSSFVFRGGRYDKIRIVVVESGTGFARARRATQALIDAHSPKWILSSGFAGALVPSVKIGDIVVANSIVDTHGQSLMIDVAFPPDPERGLHIGRILTSDAIVRLVSEKQQLAAQLGAIAVDMESLAVAQVCRERGIRCLSVRSISDDVSNDLPPEVLTLMGPTGTTRFGAALGAIFRRPESVKDMWKLRESAHLAAGRLATFLDGIVIQLYNSQH